MQSVRQGDNHHHSPDQEQETMTKTRTAIGYNVYGSDGAFCGYVDTLEDARELASKKPAGLEESLWETARKAGHCGGMRAPETNSEADEPCAWLGDYSLVPVFAPLDATVAGKQVQHDASGQGHAWRNIDCDDIPADVRMEIEGEIIDGKRDSGELIASNGLHYRW
jgi:hypothetical protein